MPMPHEIGPYRVLRPLARGGMAEVYEVEETRTGEHLAVKLLTQTGGALPRFKREYEAMIRLNHPNIVRVYSYGMHGDHPWLSMELIEGTAIQAYAKRCGKPGTQVRTDEVLRVAHDLALALDHIHQRGLVHRDLKSANVLVLPDSRVKLIDFGTARVSDPVQDITRDGEFIGTFAYASPEQLTNKLVDGRSDLYSFGVLLFRLATGKRPFDSGDLAELARMHVKQAPPSPRGLAPQIPAGLEQIILALLEKSPEARPQTGAEVAEALEAVAGRPLLLPSQLDVDLGRERLVGRESQLRALWAFLDGEGSAEREGAGAEPGAMALVVGPQGAGRHQLMKAMERECGARGWRTVNLLFRPGADDLDQFLAMLITLTRTFDGATAESLEPVRLIGEMTRSPSLSVPERLKVLQSAGAQLFRVRAHTDRHPVVLLVRGLQHAGGVGYEALVGLRDEVHAVSVPLLLIGDCTENADEPGSMTRHRLHDAMRVTLPPMNVREVALLVGALLHRRPPPAGVARRIYAASGGLPTYVEEVVKDMVADGMLQVGSRDQNRIEWARGGSLKIGLPEGARERVLEELASLPADRRRCLEVLALGGGEGSIHVIAGALDCRTSEVIPALEDLANRGWITLTAEEDIPYARWRQVLAEPVVLEQLNACRRRVLERTIIGQIAEEPAFVAQIKLLLDVGSFHQAFSRAHDWAIHHLARNRPVTALEVLDFVVPALAEVEVDDLLRAELYLAHAASLLVARPTDAATGRSLQQAQELFERSDTLGRDQASARAEIQLTRARVQRVIGHYPNFRAKLLEAWQHLEDAEASVLASTVATLLGWSHRMAGNLEEAAAWHGRARRIAVELSDPVMKAHADTGVAAWQYSHGLLVEAETTLRGAMQACSAAQDVGGVAEALSLYTHTLRLQGRFSEGLDLLHDQLPAIREGETPTFYVRLLLANAWCEVDLGRLGRAQECVDELGATLRRGEHLDLRLEADLVWGRILVASGLFADAIGRLVEVRDRAGAAGLLVMAETARALQAEALWSTGDQLGSIKTFKQAIDTLHRAGDLPALMGACVCQVRAMSESADPDLVFRPIDEWLESQPLSCARIERQIARGRYLMAMGKPAEGAFRQAEALIERLADGLSPTDAAALRLHPWTRHIRRARRT